MQEGALRNGVVGGEEIATPFFILQQETLNCFIACQLPLGKFTYFLI